MQEVFTISGAPDFDFGAVKRDPAIAKLQSALRALGSAAKDSALLKVVADGIIGPVTVAATNRALTTHIGSGQATATVRTGKLNAAAIVYRLGYITGVIATEAARRGGGAVPPPKPKVVVKRTTTTVSTLVPDSIPPDGGASSGGGFSAFIRKPVVVGGIGVALGLIAAGIGISMALDDKSGGGAAPAAPAMAGSGFGAALTKQHFIAIADVLCTHSASRDLTASFARYFKAENPRFDENRFIKAATTCPAYRHAA